MEQELICRICLSNTSKCISIYTMLNYYGQTFTISKMIMACAPVEISEDDGLPSKICDNCLKHLEISFMFRIRVLQANEKLKNYLRTKLVPNLQPVCVGFIEPLVFPSIFDEDIKQLFPWKKLLQSTVNDADPLFVDPLAKLIEQSDIKTEPEIFPFEEVMLPTNTINFSTDELPCAMRTTTESESLITDRNTNLLNQLPPIVNYNSLTEQQNNTNLENIEWNSSVLHLTEKDTNFIQNLIQTIESDESNRNTKYILVKNNQINTLSAANNKQMEPKEHLCDQNTFLPSSSQSNVQSSISNKKVNIPINTSLNISSNLKWTNKQSFEDELKNFVEQRQKYLDLRKDAFCSKPATLVSGISKNQRVEKDIVNSAVKPDTKKRKNSESSSIDLTSDNDIPANVSPKNPTNTTKNLETSQNISNNSTTSTFFNEVTVRNGDNKIVRLTIEEDQSSCIIIDD